MRMRTLVVMALAAALAGAGGAAAQEPAPDQRAVRDAEKQMRDAEKQLRDAQRQLEQAARQLATLQAGKAKELSKLRTVWFGKRARLGIVVSEDPNPATDSVGAVVRAVTPGGPADEAGLKAGDIVTKLDGKPLVGGSGGDEEVSGPAEKLMELAGDLEDGQKATIEYRRGGQTRTAAVTARAMSPHANVFFDREMELPDFSNVPVPRDVDVRVVTIPERWLDMELVPLDADLGAYFGAQQGLLVVRAPRDASLGLKSGDVIVKIGDRTPATPVQAVRILRSYDPGDTVKVEVIRQHATTTLALRLPEHGESATHPPGAAPAAPVAPGAPVSPPPADDDL